MNFTNSRKRRELQAKKWFAPARFGLFYHWGLYTGGGCTHNEQKWQRPLTYPNVCVLEKAVPDPAKVAENMANNAVRCGAKYITLTALHSCDGYCVIYPTKLKGFIHRTNLDYLGEFIRSCSAKGIRPIIYMPCGPEHWNTPGGPWIEEGFRDNASFANLLKGLVEELAILHGDRIGGFWIDGMTPELKQLPGYMHKILPDCIVINNNNTFLDIHDVDYGTTEFLSDTPCPHYCRPNALHKVEQRFGITPPGTDFNEDIPACNGWWYKKEHDADSIPYLEDPNFLVRQMLSSIGQRGQWNFALGIGPCVDGSIPPEFEPSFKRLGEFMEWGSEAVYGTTGGEHSIIAPGWFNAPWSRSAGFCSVTVSLKSPSTHFLIVTEAPSTDSAAFHTNGSAPTSIRDLRTGKLFTFTVESGILLKDIEWSDVENFGAKVFKVEFD